MGNRIKVDRISSLQEVEYFSALGVSILGFSVGDKIPDGRWIGEHELEAIFNRFARGPYSLHLDRFHVDLDYFQYINHRFHFPYVQVDYHQFEIEIIQPSLKDQQDLICSGIQADHDMEIGWIEAAVREVVSRGAKYCILEVLTDIEDAWAHLLEAEKYEGEFTVQELLDLSRQYPIMLSLNYARNNIQDVSRMFGQEVFYHFTLGDISGDPYLKHLVDFQTALDLVSALRV
ncbi:hypothetical protein HY468_05730 [Candidatus Roizmanbacteria bacterium]|nr:hypothetical protein [Candidatus Roizmanbacteria bacterium]